MRAGGIALIVLGILAAVAGFVIPVVAQGRALAQTAALDESVTSVGTVTAQLNQDALIDNPENPYDVGIPITREVVAVADVPAAEAGRQETGVAVEVINTRTTVTRTDSDEQMSVAAATYPFDPKTSQLVNCCGANVNGNADVALQGISPVKFPFDTEATTYQVFSPVLLGPVPTTFVEDVDQYGLRLRTFVQEIPATQTPAAPLTLPAGLAAGLVGQLAPQLAEQIPAAGEVDLYEFYAATTTYLVEPQTGRIVDSKVTERTTYRLNGGDTDIVTKSEVTLAGQDPAGVAAAVSTQAGSLVWAERALPLLVGAGLSSVIAGIVMVIVAAGRRSGQPADALQA